MQGGLPPIPTRSAASARFIKLARPQETNMYVSRMRAHPYVRDHRHTPDCAARMGGHTTCTAPPMALRMTLPMNPLNLRRELMRPTMNCGRESNVPNGSRTVPNHLVRCS